MSLVEKVGFTQKQAYSIVMILIILGGAMVLPPELWEAWFGATERITRDVIREEIQQYIDDTILAVPIASTLSLLQKPNSFMIGIYGSYAFAINGTAGKLWEYSTTHGKLFDWVDGNITNRGTIHVGKGTYQLSACTWSNDWVMIGEYGARFNLTAKPSITISAENSTIENVVFYSIVDGYGHIILSGANATFVDCPFKLRLDTEDELGVIRYQSATPGHVRFIRCSLRGGEADGTHFFFYYTETDSKSMTIDDFHIFKTQANTNDGLVRLWEGDSAKICTQFHASMIVWDNATGGGTSNKHSCFVYFGFRAKYATIEGFYSLATHPVAHGMSPCSSFADHLIIDGLYCMGTSTHGYSGRRSLVMSNFLINGSSPGVVPATNTGWDLQSGSSYPDSRTATISNGQFFNSSLDVNTHWDNVNIDNVEFYNSRLWIGDEGATKSIERYITVSNSQWFWEDYGGWDYCIIINYDHRLQLSKLLIDNCNMKGYGVFITCGNANKPTHIIIRGFGMGPKIDGNWPVLFDTGTRNHTSQRITIVDSDIVTKLPPLASWNPILANDTFSGVKWYDITQNRWEYSERVFNVTISSGSSSGAANHLMPARTIWSNFQVTPTSDLANCTYFWSTWADLTATQLTVRVGAAGAEKNCNDDITFVVQTELKP